MKTTEKTVEKEAIKANQSDGCENCDWMHCNGVYHCPYCNKHL